MQTNYPVYKKTYGTQWFKIIDEKTVLNIRNDETISGYGIADSMSSGNIDAISGFDDSSETEFNEEFLKVINKVNLYKP